MTYLTVSQIKLINAEIAAAKQGSPLYQKPAVEDPSDKLIAAHTATLEWHMQSRKFSMTAAELVRLQEKSVEVLDLLKANLPEKNGVKNAWKFERRTAFCTRFVSLSCLAGLRISVPRDLNTVILTLSRRLHTAHTIRTCF